MCENVCRVGSECVGPYRSVCVCVCVHCFTTQCVWGTGSNRALVFNPPMLLSLLAAVLTAPAIGLSVPPLRQRNAALGHAHLVLLRVGESAAPTPGNKNAPVALLEATAGGEGAVVKTLKLTGVTAFTAAATGGVGAALTPNAALSAVAFVGIAAAPGTESAKKLGPVEAVVVSVEMEGGDATYKRIGRGAVTVATGAPLTAAPSEGGGYYLSFASPGAPVSWFPGGQDEPATSITFGIPRCSFVAPRVLLDPPQLVFWAAGGGCGGGVGLSASRTLPNPPAPQTAAPKANDIRAPPPPTPSLQCQRKSRSPRWLPPTKCTQARSPATTARPSTATARGPRPGRWSRAPPPRAAPR